MPFFASFPYFHQEETVVWLQPSQAVAALAATRSTTDYVLHIDPVNKFSLMLVNSTKDVTEMVRKRHSNVTRGHSKTAWIIEEVGWW